MLRIYQMSLPAMGLFTVGLTVAVSLLLFAVVRRLMRRLSHPGNEVVYCFLGATGVIYALVLGLLAVATWDSLKAVEEAATKEALEVGKLYWDLAGYAPAQRDQLRGKLREYLRTVIEVEWPQQQKGQAVLEPEVLMDITETWVTVEPAEGRKLIHAEALGELNELLSFRRARVQGAEVALPGVLWVVVLLGGVINVGICSMIRTEQAFVLGVLVAGFAFMVGLMIFEIVAVDRPLLGKVSIQSTPYVEVLRSLGR